MFNLQTHVLVKTFILTQLCYPAVWYLLLLRILAFYSLLGCLKTNHNIMRILFKLFMTAETFFLFPFFNHLLHDEFVHNLIQILWEFISKLCGYSNWNVFSNAPEPSKQELVCSFKRLSEHLYLAETDYYLFVVSIYVVLKLVFFYQEMYYKNYLEINYLILLFKNRF